MTTKDSLWLNIRRNMKAFTGKNQKEEYNFCPKSYVFPENYEEFCFDREASKNKQMYITKPSGGMKGVGIKIIGPDTPVANKKDTIISEYITNPLLINGYKWDMRMYVLVNSFDPLNVFFYPEGAVRFASQKYSGDP